ncbi:hypothetical protein GN956_G4420 [Arapaima gigas]
MSEDAKERVEQEDNTAAAKEMTDFERGLIIGFHKGGKSVPEIVKMTGLPQRFVKRFLKDWERGVIDAYTGLYKDGTALGRDSEDSDNEG